jgi:hypothetical protein
LHGELEFPRAATPTPEAADITAVRIELHDAIVVTIQDHDLAALINSNEPIVYSKEGFGAFVSSPQPEEFDKAPMEFTLTGIVQYNLETGRVRTLNGGLRPTPITAPVREKGKDADHEDDGCFCWH